MDPWDSATARVLHAGEELQHAPAHRRERPRAARLETVPCWVREMDDDEAYMALLLTNTQSELHPLEEGFHALHSGLNGSEYARQIGKPQTTLADKIKAARVAEHINAYALTDLQPCWRPVAEIHAAPQWLWSALVTKLLAEAWTVEKTREHVKRIQKLEAPPEWVDRETVATNTVVMIDTPFLGPESGHKSTFSPAPSSLTPPTPPTRS